MFLNVLNRGNRDKRLRRGLTLIESAMVLAVFALVIGGIMMYYQSATTSQKISEAAGQVSSIQQAVRSMYAGQSSYSGLTNANITMSLPRSMLGAAAGDIRNAFNGGVTVSPTNSGGGSANAFIIEFSSLPVEACVRLASLDMGRSAIGVNVNNRGVRVPPLTPTVAQTDCADNNASTIAWTLY